MARTKYTLADVGCYVDSARGIHSVDRIIAIANSHGASIKHDCKDNSCGFDGQSLSSCEFADEYEDEAADYMNDHYGVDGAVWGRSEQGDWGLWTSEDDSEPEADDITTEDHRRFYQSGKLWLEISEDDDMNAAIKAQMERDQFFPNVWFISDHGNAHLISLED